MTSDGSSGGTHSPRLSATMVATLANDLRNALTVITTSVNAIRDSAPHYPELERAFLDVYKATDAAFHVAEQMAAVVRPPRGALSMAELNEVVSQGRHLIERLVGRNVQVTFNVTPLNPIVRAAAIDVEWLILNLVSNADDAMPRGGELTIETELVTVPSGTPDPRVGRVLPYGRLTVSDTGRGMNARVRARAIEPFFSTRSGAFGLGLTSAALIVRRLGGFLRVARTGHHGTSLEAYLPAQDPYAEATSL